MAATEDENIQKIIASKPRPSEEFENHEMGWPSDLANEKGKTFDSPDEIANKEALKHFLAATPFDAAAMPDLPVQGKGIEKRAANQLFQLFFKSYSDGDAQQGIHSQLYQDENGHLIFCRDMRAYDKDKPIDHVYEYARYGIGLYISQHILYQAYGIEDTQFIAENAEKFYKQFIRDIEAHREELKKVYLMSDAAIAEELNQYARKYLANVAYSIAEQLTDRLGAKHEAFCTEDASLAALDTTLVSATMACEPIPYVVVKSLAGSEYADMVHPKPFQMTADMQELYEDESKFLNQNPVKQKVIGYLLLSPEKRKVSLCSQDRSKLIGAKNVRKRESLKIVREANEEVQCLLSLTKTAAGSTTFSALKGVDEHTLQEYNTKTLLQEYEMLAPGDTEQGYRLAVISLCGVDIIAKTGLKKIDPLDYRIVKSNKQSATNVALQDKMSNNNVAINFECVFGKFKGNDLASKSVQKLLEVTTGEKDSAEMLEDLYNINGIKEDLQSIRAFKETLDGDDQRRLQQYLLLMERALQKRNKASFLDSLKLSIDVVAVFVLLCQQYNQLLARKPNKAFKAIIPAINCASGENRSGVVLQRIDVLSFAADILGIDQVPELLDEEYTDLLLSISDEVATIGVTLWENGYFGSTPGTGGVRPQTGKNSLTGLSRPQKLALMCPSSDWKRLNDVYKKDENRIDIFRVLNELCRTVPEMSLQDRRENYRKTIETATPFSILYTLNILRDPTLLSHLSTDDLGFIEDLLLKEEAHYRYKHLISSPNISHSDRESILSERSESDNEWSDSEDEKNDLENKETSDNLTSEALSEAPSSEAILQQESNSATLANASTLSSGESERRDLS
ncbi:MAG: hypothetical protein K2Q33_02690, partial [Gammaproteobacteria bacterium]|nr:hypothetical protein [Gammaproteobacteria bacterium]